MRQSSSKLIYRIRIVFTWGGLWWNEGKKSKVKSQKPKVKKPKLKSQKSKGKRIARAIDLQARNNFPWMVW
jgi:hypothetical protein